MLISIIILIIMIVLLATRKSRAAAILTGIWAVIYSALFAYGLSIGVEVPTTSYSQILLVWIMFVVAGIVAITRKGK